MLAGADSEPPCDVQSEGVGHHLFLTVQNIHIQNNNIQMHTNISNITPDQTHLLTPPFPAPTSLSATWPQTTPFCFSPFPPFLTTMCLKLEKGHFSSNLHTGDTTLLKTYEHCGNTVKEMLFMCQGLSEAWPTLCARAPTISDVPQLAEPPEGTVVTMSLTPFRQEDAFR